MRTSVQRRVKRFFYLSMLYTNVRVYYETTHILHTYLNYSIEDIENMYPYEREIYMLLFKNDKEREKRELERKRRYG